MDYELIDAGGGKKLERFGKVITIRPEVNAYFRSGMDFPKWYEKAHFEFVETQSQKGYWKELNPINTEEWIFKSGLGFSMFLEKTKFKHVGLFPEQLQHWKYIQQYIKEGDSFLNLFGYTGAASLAAKAKKANVTHVDSVKQVVTWSRKNMELSNLSDIRWIVDDAFTYIQREQRRGNKHKGIIMDPPAFGIGKNNKRWLIEDKIEDLLKVAYSCLDKNGFLLVNTYSPKIKTEDLKSLAKRNIKHHKSEVFPLVQKTKTGKILEHNLCLKIHP